MLAGAEVMKRTGFDRDRDILSEPDDGAPSVRPRSAKTAVRRCLCHRKDSWHMRAAATIVTLCLLVAPGCDNRQRPQQSVSARPAVEREADHLDVIEAVFRYQFTKNPSSRDKPAYFFVSVASEADPPSRINVAI
jgi:hypothetical protein